MTDEHRLRETFDSAATRYHAARPDYPESMFDALADTAGLAAGDRVLEIGCGTGKATVALARRGLVVDCVELGPRLAAEARRRFADRPTVTVVEADFETWRPTGPADFDLVFAATAWHWIDPAVGYRRAWELLRPGGHLAFWSAGHVFPENGDPFFDEIQPTYDAIGEGHDGPAPRPGPGGLPDRRAEILDSGYFEPVHVEQFDWIIEYDAESYLRLLDTFSGHIAMAPWQRDRLYAEIRRRLALRPDGLLRRGWGAVLHVARRRAEPVSPATR